MCLYQTVLTTKLKLIWDMCCKKMIWTQERFLCHGVGSGDAWPGHWLGTSVLVEFKTRVFSQNVSSGLYGSMVFHHFSPRKWPVQICLPCRMRSQKMAICPCMSSLRQTLKRPETCHHHSLSGFRYMDVESHRSQFELVMILSLYMLFKIDIIWTRIWCLKVKSKVSPNFTTNDLISEGKAPAGFGWRKRSRRGAREQRWEGDRQSGGNSSDIISLHQCHGKYECMRMQHLAWM